MHHQDIYLVNHGETVATDSNDYLVAKFNQITDDWDTPLNAIFVNSVDNVPYTVMVGQEAQLEADECFVPWEVLVKSGYVYVSVFCGSRHTTSIARFKVVESGYVAGETPGEPTPTVYEQLLQAFDNVYTKAEVYNKSEVYNKEEITEHITSIQSAIDNLDSTKADKATTLAGYNITDAYTKIEVDEKLLEGGKYHYDTESTQLSPTIIEGAFCNDSGDFIANQFFDHTDYLDVQEFDGLKITSAYGYNAVLVAFYDQSKNFISYVGKSSGNLITVTDYEVQIPENAHYAVINCAASKIGILSISALKIIDITIEDKLKQVADDVDALDESKNYNNLENKPSINGVTLSGDKTSEDLHIEAGGTDDYEELINKPQISVGAGDSVGTNIREIEIESIINFDRDFFYYDPEFDKICLSGRVFKENNYGFDYDFNLIHKALFNSGWKIVDTISAQNIPQFLTGYDVFAVIQLVTPNTRDGKFIRGVLTFGDTQTKPRVFIQTADAYHETPIAAEYQIINQSEWIELGAGSQTKDISAAVVTLNQYSFTYDGSSHVPNVTAVTLNGQALTLGVDYAVVSVPATNAGDYVVTISGMGDYSGTAVVEWTIGKAQATISGDDSISIRGVGESVSKTYTTNGDGTFSFSASGGVATVTNVDGTVTVTSTEIGSGTMIVTVAEGQNYLGATKTVNITVEEVSAVTVFGVMWDYSLSSPELTRLTPESDPLGVVTTVPEQEPTACIGTEGGQSDFDNYNPWASIMRFNYVNGQIVDFVDYTNGETYVYIPEFWSKIVDDSANQKMYFYVSDSELNGFAKHLGSGRYIGRYACDVNYASKPNGEPKHRISISNFRSGVTALDNKHYLIDIHSFSAIQLLYIIEFANLNSQSKIGEGLTNVSQIQNLGLTDSLIYHTGRTAGVNDQSAIHYRWIENLWGNVSEYVDGILTSGTKVYFCDDYTHYDNVINSFYYDTNLELPNLNNEFIKTENCFNNGYLLPKTIGASSTTYACDRFFLALGTRVMRVGGIFNSTNAAGIFAVSYSDSPTDTPTNCCGRSILILNTGGNS